MSLINRPIPNLFSGVSQQSPSLRNPAQCELQENAYPSIARGLRKRPPTQHLAKLRSTTATDAHIHVINRDIAERYAVIILNGSIEVYDLTTGAAKTVTTPDGVGYLAATTPRSDFAAVTVADHTFIINRTVTVAMDAATTTGTLLGTKQKFSDLPTTNAMGDIWKIAGSPESADDEYYVQWNGSVWVEHTNPGITYLFNATTMPHKLVRNADGTFTFSKITWDNRLVGDDNSNPAPSFVGDKIKDVFFHRDRLGFAAGENLILSRAGSYYNFWAETATAVLDSDPIDVSVAHTKVSLLNYAVAFNGALMAFSDQTQFELTSGDILSPKSVKITPATQFESSPKARPVGSGQDLFFAVEKGEWTNVREYFVDKETITNDAADVTAHVPEYIPHDVFKLAISSAEDLLVAMTLQERNTLYCYKYYWGTDEKVQSAWFKIVFATGDVLLGGEFIGNTLYLLIQRTDGVYLEKMSFQSNASESDLDFLVHLDRKQSITGVYDSVADTTTWTLPYADDGSIAVILGGSFTGQKGNVLNTTRPSSTTVRATGNYSSGACYVGRNYTMKYRFSEQFIKDSNNISIHGGRLQLRTMTLDYYDTGYFEVHVTPTARDTYTYKFTGKKLGASSLLLGAVNIADGFLRFPIQSNSKEVTIEVQNSSYLPCFLIGAEWEGFFTLRSQRRIA